MTNPNDDMLDDMFAQVRSVQSDPSDALTARVLADAVAVQAASVAVQTVPPRGLWARMLDGIGGWPAVSGLAAATIAGVWIGVAPPSSMQDLTASFIGDEVSVNLFSTDFAFDTGVSVDG